MLVKNTGGRGLAGQEFCAEKRIKQILPSILGVVVFWNNPLLWVIPENIT